MSSFLSPSPPLTFFGNSLTLSWVDFPHRYWHGSIYMMTLAFIFTSHSTFPSCKLSLSAERGELSHRSTPPLFGSTKEKCICILCPTLTLLLEYSSIISSNQHRVIVFRNTKQGSQLQIAAILLTLQELPKYHQCNWSSVKQHLRVKKIQVKNSECCLLLWITASRRVQGRAIPN